MLLLTVGCSTLLTSCRALLHVRMHRMRTCRMRHAAFCKEHGWVFFEYVYIQGLACCASQFKQVRAACRQSPWIRSGSKSLVADRVAGNASLYCRYKLQPVTAGRCALCAQYMLAISLYLLKFCALPKRR